MQRFLVESAMPEGGPSLLARRALYREFFAARRDLHGASTNLNLLADLANQRRELLGGVAECACAVGAVMDRLVNVAGLLVAHTRNVPRGGRRRCDREGLAEPGAHGYMGFSDQGGAVVVETVEPPTRFSFRWNHPEGEEPVGGNSMLVEFTLTPEGPERTRLRAPRCVAPPQSAGHA